MSQSEKSAYYQALKSAGMTFEGLHYRELTTAALKEAYDALAAQGPVPPLELREPAPVAPPAPPMPTAADPDPEAAAFFGIPVPQRAADPNEMAGQRQNTQEEEVPLRTDPDTGFLWYQEEVRKPGYPKARGRRVLTYMDSGSVQKVVKNGDYMETFEVSGDPANARPAEVKITLPSYQVGIYRDPNYPFKIYTYNHHQGFDLFEVQAYFGGAERVPTDIKRVYVENVLCYDMRTTVRAIQDEYAQHMLAGRIR